MNIKGKTVWKTGLNILTYLDVEDHCSSIINALIHQKVVRMNPGPLVAHRDVGVSGNHVWYEKGLTDTVIGVFSGKDELFVSKFW